MLVIPSRGRPESLQRFFERSNVTVRGVVVLDSDDDHNYQDVDLPLNWEWLTVKPMKGFSAKANLAYKEFPDEQWYGFCGDDCVGRTEDWDLILSSFATNGYIAWGNDLLNSRCTQPFIPGSFVRELGWLCHPALKHLYVDTVWEDIAGSLSVGIYFPDIIQEHFHFANGKAPRDQTSRERMHEEDAETFSTINLESLVEKLRPCVSTPF